MPSTWTITPPVGASPVTLASLCLELTGGDYVLMGESTMRLRLGEEFDTVTASLWAYKDEVILYRDGAKFFHGNVSQTERMADPNESIEVIVSDPWWWLENIVFQQEWAQLASGSVELPLITFGRDSAGATLTTTGMVEEAIDYAIAAGAPMQKGTIDAGLTLWPTEARNLTCAQVIRQAMRWHPQWAIYIDHSTTPTPTIHVRKRANLTTRNITLGTDCVASLNFRPRYDLQPEAVRLIYHTINEIDGTPYRATQEDLWPTAKTGKEHGAVNQVIDLAGMRAQFQKQEIQTSTIPETAADADAEKDFLKIFIPGLKDTANANFQFSAYSRELVAESLDEPDPINPNATRLSLTDEDDLPRALVRGGIQDWMRVKVGKIRLKGTIEVKAAGLPLSDEQLKFWGALARKDFDIEVTGTDATTKLYRGRTFWQPPTEAPSGLAQAIYEERETLEWEGNITLSEDELPLTRFHGTALNFTGGLTAWQSMAATIGRARWDVASRSLQVAFGPRGRYHLGPQDLIEILRTEALNRAVWWSSDERSSPESGSNQDSGSNGDTAGNYDVPEVRGGLLSGNEEICPLGDMLEDSSGDPYLRQGYINAAAIHDAVGGDGTTFTATIGHHVWAEVTITASLTDSLLDGGWSASGAAISSGASLPDNHAWTDSSNVGKAYAPLGQWVDDGAGNPAWKRAGCGDVTFHFCAPNTVSATASYHRG